MRAFSSLVLAWSVHLLTAGGAIAGMLAAAALAQERWKFAFTCLMVATAIDAVDGKLARAARVKEVIPGFDGTLLDNIVDFFTYVIVPAMFFLFRPEMLPEGWVIATATAMVLTSAYQFCQSDAKTDDHYFKGFPSYWNIVALYLFLFDFQPLTNCIILLALAVMVFVPIKYIYPSRTVRFQKLTIALALLWSAAMIALLVQYPAHSPALLWVSLLFVAYYTLLSFWLTLRIARG